jgi:hypothetical protein
MAIQHSWKQKEDRDGKKKKNSPKKISPDTYQLTNDRT